MSFDLFALNAKNIMIFQHWLSSFIFYTKVWCKHKTYHMKDIQKPRFCLINSLDSISGMSERYVHSIDQHEHRKNLSKTMAEKKEAEKKKPMKQSVTFRCISCNFEFHNIHDLNRHYLNYHLQPTNSSRNDDSYKSKHFKKQWMDKYQDKNK